MAGVEQSLAVSKGGEEEAESLERRAMPVLSSTTTEPLLHEWITVEQSISCMAANTTKPPLTQPPSSHQTLTSITSEEITETDVTEKRTKKKKTESIENGEVLTNKTKKKKSKKSDEKENHISVTTNGHGGPPSPLPQNDLMNVSVKNLTESYVSEANKSFNWSKCCEEPVTPSVPIRELRRSFGDIHSACEISELSPKWDDDKHLWAGSLGDLRKIEREPVITGVSVKQLAAYWRTVSIESISRSTTSLPDKLEKSSFSKFDQLTKKTVLHVRSSDPAKAQKTFSQSLEGENASCKSCGKTVFAMEQVKAERAVWHKNCFRCQTCNKQLTVDIYSSHEGELYCKPHFRELFKPKAIVESDEPASDKPDLGLEELSSLNLKSKFQVFEKNEINQELERSPSKVDVKRSPSILSKLAKFQKKGMDVGVTDEDLDGFCYEETSSEEEEDNEDKADESGVVKCRKVREKPVSFGKMSDVKRTFEAGPTKKEERLEERKQEIQNLRSRLFMGKQVKMKEMYEQAVAESEGKVSKKESDVVRSEKAKQFRDRFEKGEQPVHSDQELDDESKNKQVADDSNVFEEGIGKMSRNLFMEMDAKNAAAPTANHPTPAPRDTSRQAHHVVLSRPVSEDIIRSSDAIEDVSIQTADVSSKFKFFEKYKAPEKEKRTFRITPPREGQVKTESPEREVYRDPDVVRSDDKIEDDSIIMKSQTTSKMLSIFRQMEEHKPVLPQGPKPPKEFTPPPDFREREDSESEEESEEEEDSEGDESEDDGIIKASDKVKDEFLEGGKSAAARARDLAAKFESWEPEKQSTNSAVAMLDSEHPSLESTKSLRAHFESLKNQKISQEGKARPKVNRFVDGPSSICTSCETRVYPLERIETDGRIFHRACFRCSHCNCILRMDSYTLNCGHLYCLPHFKQLFISKGNYDEGFGVDQHKRKWEISTDNNTI